MKPADRGTKTLPRAPKSYCGSSWLGRIQLAGPDSRGCRHEERQPSPSISIAALRPLMAMTLPPGCVQAPQRKRPGMGVRGEKRLSHMFSGRHSPWKMWPPVKPTSRSMSGGPRTWTSMIASGYSRSIGRSRRSRVRDFVAAAIPIAAFKCMRDVLREDAHRVHALGCHARVVGGLKIKLAPEPVGQSAGAGGLVSRLPLCLRERRVDLAQVVRHVACRGGP